MNSDELFEAARAVRPWLPELVDSDWHELDEALARLLVDPAEDGAGIVALVQAYPEVGAWVTEFIARGGPPAMADVVEKGGGAQSPPGLGALLLPPRYACPVDGAYVQYVTAPSQLMTCPQHGVTLEPAPR
ncbi:hypothetical protein GCM10027053_24550 [Intrasporangium mesophilum]